MTEATANEVSAEVRDMTGPEAPPRQNGELVFEAPWQGEVFGLAVGLVRSRGLGWDHFRHHLITAIEQAPDRPYYESWTTALEQLIRELGVARPIRGHEPGVGDIERFPLATDEATLREVLVELFERWWPHIRYGPIIQGAVWEGRADQPPRITMLDGYLTVDVGSWHFHLCIGEHTGRPGEGVDPHVARRRRCARAELYRQLHDDAPVSWGLRMFNGDGEQQITVLLPNPFLDDDQQVLDSPDWTRLECWDHLRQRFLGLGPDPLDRTASAFHHG